VRIALKHFLYKENISFLVRKKRIRKLLYHLLKSCVSDTHAIIASAIANYKERKGKVSKFPGKRAAKITSTLPNAASRKLFRKALLHIPTVCDMILIRLIK